MFEDSDDPLWEGSRETWMCQEMVTKGEDVLGNLRTTAPIILDQEDRAWLAFLLQWAADEFNTSYHADSMEGSILEICQRVQEDITKRLRDTQMERALMMTLTEVETVLAPIENDEDERLPRGINLLAASLRELQRNLKGQSARSVHEFYC